MSSPNSSPLSFNNVVGPFPEKSTSFDNENENENEEGEIQSNSSLDSTASPSVSSTSPLPPPSTYNKSQLPLANSLNHQKPTSSLSKPNTLSSSSSNTNSTTTQKHSLDLLTRTGGAYIPPAKLRALQDLVTDKSSEAYQRITWEALKKSINGLINKVNTSNLKNIIPELIHENLIRGRGLFCRSIMKSQHAALPFTPVYAALVAVLNTKFPALGEILCSRLILQFQRSYQRNLKSLCLSSLYFLAHLMNQKVVHELVVLEILTLLLERPSEDAMELAVGLMKESGAYLVEQHPKAVHALFDRFRSILHEASSLSLRTQYMIEILFQIRKDQFKQHPTIPSELDMVDEEDRITHYLPLDDPNLNPQEECNVFKFDSKYLENEEKYNEIKHEILGESEDENTDGEREEQSSEEEEEEEDDDEEEEEEEEETTGVKRLGEKQMERNRGKDSSDSRLSSSKHHDMHSEQEVSGSSMSVIDATQRDVLSLRKLIYLTLMSSLDFEECCHKLLKINIHPSQASELCNMILECCSQERTYMKFYGLMAERFCKLNRLWTEEFCHSFVSNYETIHRYETGRLRNIAKLFSHLLFTDAIPWTVFQCIYLTEETTTSASRIFIKVLFQELLAHFGIAPLLQRLQDPFLTEYFVRMFPKDHPRHTRFAINFWTSIGLGAVTDDLREWLKTAPTLVAPPQSSTSSSSEDDDSSTSSSYYSSSPSPRRSPISPIQNSSRRSPRRPHPSSSPSPRRSPTSPIQKSFRRSPRRPHPSSSPSPRRSPTSPIQKSSRRSSRRPHRYLSPSPRRSPTSPNQKSSRRSPRRPHHSPIGKRHRR
ncbi:pre-mRNA-splicing factor cwc22 [Coelomomyces lativittatus]|nr:pre-mRNA-splicing factor cwc22 [Coelomomyces lativittatus]